MGVIYKITNPKGREYVGKTYNLKHRIASHKCNSKKETGIILMNSIRKYGWDAHTIEVIEEVDDNLLNEREIFWIKELKTYCYENKGQMNMTLGGEGQRSTWKHNTERVKHHSAMMAGENNPFYGKLHSESIKKRIGIKASIRNKKTGWTIPKWGAEKGRLKVIKEVIVYSSNGNFINEFSSVIEASKFTNQNHTSVSMICGGKRSHAGGFVFRYKTENYPLKIEVKLNQQTKARPVYCFIRKKRTEYACAEIASDDLKIPKGTISRASLNNNGRPIRTGHIFIYKDLYEKFKKVS